MPILFVAVLLVALLLVYFQCGLLTVIELILLIIILLASNFLSGINPDPNLFLYIKIFAIITIIYLLYHDYNIMNAYKLALLPIKNLDVSILPVSIDKITYFDELESINYIDTNFENKVYLTDISEQGEIFDIINSLEEHHNYVASIEFTTVFPEEGKDLPRMILSKPIMINKYSSPTIISMFIHDRLNLMVDFYYLDDEIIQLSEIGPYICIRYQQFLN